MRNKIGIGPVSVALIAALAGCSSGNNGESGQAVKDAATPAQQAGPAELAKQAAQQPAELVIGSSSGATNEQFMRDYGTKISEKFPNYKIKYVEGSFKTYIESGQSYDIFISSVGLTPASVLTYNLQSDISDLVQKYRFDMTGLEPSTIDIQRQLAGGGIYGLPVNTTSAALFYNKDLFDRFGVPYPKDGMTWEDQYDLAKKMTRSDEGTTYRGLTMAFQHLMFLNQLSAPHLDAKTYKAMFLENNFVRAFENMARFYKIPGNELPGNTFYLNNQQDPFYKDKTVAMLLTLSTGGVNFGDWNWDIAKFPVFKDKPDVGPQSYPNYFYVTSTSKQRDAAFQVLSYVASEEFQMWQAKTGTPAVLKDKSKTASVFGVDKPLYKGKHLTAILPDKFADPTVKTLYQAAADKEVNAALGAYAAGQDVNTVLREAAERADKAIAATKGK
ncbi:ABC transporter substrate-binding protein [Paenibacillus ginsengarvi]|uniref:Extracellular solute-binding protein n=1 Tax=Paenibacillus ginsengarvi TaxID=400777 RepID=A0A3B0CB11_9BACL|nr:extracellular solute-binding protein [Paenibacillus ginsengarvi]RKN82001.1 extracellular solute-binding protein [Paenibacillus ginsengarvi]